FVAERALHRFRGAGRWTEPPHRLPGEVPPRPGLHRHVHRQPLRGRGYLPRRSGGTVRWGFPRIDRGEQGAGGQARISPLGAARGGGRGGLSASAVAGSVVVARRRIVRLSAYGWVPPWEFAAAGHTGPPAAPRLPGLRADRIGPGGRIPRAD